MGQQGHIYILGQQSQRNLICHQCYNKHEELCFQYNDHLLGIHNEYPNQLDICVGHQFLLHLWLVFGKYHHNISYHIDKVIPIWVYFFWYFCDMVNRKRLKKDNWLELNKKERYSSFIHMLRRKLSGNWFLK